MQRIGIVGPLLGSRQGWVMSQGEVVAQHFRDAGYSVRTTSSFPNKLLRLADTIRAIVSWRGQVDCVLLMVFSGNAFRMAELSAKLAQLLKLPVILWLHGGSLPTFALQQPSRVRRLFAGAAAIVAPSHFLASVPPQFGLQATIIPNVLNLVDYPFKRRDRVAPKLLWMRTFHEIYNPMMALQVVQHLRQTYPEVCLTMAGQDKGLLAAIQSKVKTLDLADHIHFAGFLDMAEKQREFANHDIYLNTNRVDNMPVSVIEAAAFGLPIVATNIGGIPYLLSDEENALFVGNDDILEMAAAIRRLVEKSELAAKLSVNGRKLAESSAWSTVKRDWEALFAHVLAA